MISVYCSCNQLEFAEGHLQFKIGQTSYDFEEVTQTGKHTLFPQ